MSKIMDFIENVMFKPDTPANIRKKIRNYVKENPDASEADVLREYGPSLERAMKFEKKQKDEESTKRSDRMLIEKAKNNKARGGMPKKAQMMRGGMANGKQHMYAAGGSVTENPGLKALKASGPKGMKAYNKIMGK